jgi:predicted ATP-grasp superfamily ATP-dependent carboligase
MTEHAPAHVLRRRGAAPRTGGALVLGGAYGSLGIVRSLGRQGIPVWVLTNDHLMARFSRYAKNCPPWPEVTSARQAEYLLELGKRHNLEGWTLFPGGDMEAELCARHRDSLGRFFRLTTPCWNVMEWAYNKRLTYQLAQRLQVGLPWTCCPDSREEVERLDCPFPLVLKPAVKEEANAFTKAKAWRVDDRNALLARYDEARKLVDPRVIVLQEFVPGAGEAQFSYAALWGPQGPVASLLARRVRQYPVQFGYNSTFVETVECPEVELLAVRLLEAIAYTGLVEVEFKYDSRDGRYKLLDINARTWTWHTLGRRAGVDFPYLAWLLAQGEAVPAARGRAGVRWVHSLRDVVAAIQEIRRGTLTLKDYVHTMRGGAEHAVLAPDDPVPALMEIPLHAHRLWRRIRRR